MGLDRSNALEDARLAARRESGDILDSMTRRALVGALTAAALLAPATATAAPATGAATGRLLVSLAAPARVRAEASAVQAVIARTGARLAGPSVPQVGLIVVRPSVGTTLAALRARLRRDPRVRAVSVEHHYVLRAVPNDPALTTPDPSSSVPGLSDEWWLAREDFPRAWDVTTGTGSVVGVIDTGIDGSHPDLAGKIVHADNLDGADGGTATTDSDGHGTHVAALACAATDNGIGIAGAGWNCRIAEEKSDLTDSSVVTAIVDATDAGADAINMSFGTDGRAQAPTAIVDALRYAYRHGVVLVAAAADDATQEQGDPANVLQPTGTGPDLTAGLGLSVTAAGPDDQRARFAGYGTQISLAAYGALDRGAAKAGLLSAWPAGMTSRESLLAPSGPCLCRTTFDGDPRYAYLQGTSMAAPQVAAVGALIRHLNPDLPVARILRLLKQTARRPAGTGFTPNLGWGILDAGAAVHAASRIDARAPTSRVRAPARSRTRFVVLRLWGRDTGPRGVLVSGVRSFRVYAQRQGGRARLVAVTARRTLRLRVRPHARYTFYSRAVDRAGNVEPAPGRRAGAPRVAHVRVVG